MKVKIALPLSYQWLTKYNVLMKHSVSRRQSNPQQRRLAMRPHENIEYKVGGILAWSLVNVINQKQSSIVPVRLKYSYCCVDLASTLSIRQVTNGKVMVNSYEIE